MSNDRNTIVYRCRHHHESELSLEMLTFPAYVCHKQDPYGAVIFFGESSDSVEEGGLDSIAFRNHDGTRNGDSNAEPDIRAYALGPSGPTEVYGYAFGRPSLES